MIDVNRRLYLDEVTGKAGERFGHVQSMLARCCDRAASQQQKQAAHARSATAEPLYATLARGALLCLDSMAAPDPRPLGILRPELPRLRTARLPRCPLQAILR